jgi:hypothetical protein
VSYRDFHALSRGNGWRPGVVEIERGVEIRALMARSRQETERGLDDRSDLFVPGIFSTRLAAGDAATMLLSTETAPDMDASRALDQQRSGRNRLLRRSDRQGTYSHSLAESSSI